MIRGINKQIVQGFARGAPKVYTHKNGKKSARFSVATHLSFYDHENDSNKKIETEWHYVVVYNKLVDVAIKMINKGRFVFVCGPTRTKKFIDKNGLERETKEIMAYEIQVFPPFSKDYLKDFDGAVEENNSGWYNETL